VADPVDPGNGVGDVVVGSDPDPLHLNPGEIRQKAMAGSSTNQDGPHHLAGVGQQNRDPRSQTAPTPSMIPTAGAGCPFKRKAIGSLAR
jgi:hypothetical protein